MKVGVIGLGRLGLPLACLLSTEHEVWGYDTDIGMTHLISHGNFKTSEPDCDYSKLNIAESMEQMVSKTDIALLCVNTPTKKGGGMDLSQVWAATSRLNQELLNTERVDYQLAVCSTVMPGTCESLANMLFEVYSNSVWIAMGSVVADLRQPPMMVIGAPTPNNTVDRRLDVLDVWLPVANFEARQVILTNATTAEFLKLAHNAWCTTKMSFISYIQEFCQDVDIEQVSDFFRNGGERAGAFWKPGAPFSGPCFPRDLAFFNEWAGMPLTKETAHENQLAIQRITEKIKWGAKVLILGRAYKYGTDIEQDSLSFALAKLLQAKGCEVHVQNESVDGFDPDICIVTHRELGDIAMELDGCEVIDLWRPGEGRVAQQPSGVVN